MHSTGQQYRYGTGLRTKANCIPSGFTFLESSFSTTIRVCSPYADTGRMLIWDALERYRSTLSPTSEKGIKSCHFRDQKGDSGTALKAANPMANHRFCARKFVR